MNTSDRAAINALPSHTPTTSDRWSGLLRIMICSFPFIVVQVNLGVIQSTDGLLLCFLAKSNPAFQFGSRLVVKPQYLHSIFTEDVRHGKSPQEGSWLGTMLVMCLAEFCGHLLSICGPSGFLVLLRFPDLPSFKNDPNCCFSQSRFSFVFPSKFQDYIQFICLICHGE